MFSVVFSAVLVLVASVPAGLPQGSVVQAPSAKKSTLLASISKKDPGAIVQFGPEGCVSTWLNKQARCMIKTECTEKDIDDYNFKFICVDESGEHVRHVFGKGSFDTEETFDTLVTCSGCTADADDLFVSARQRQANNKANNTANNTVAPKSTNALLREMVQEVKELKVEMANASQNVERLNEAVFKPERTAPAATPTPSSLVHKGAARQQLVSKPSRSLQPALRARAVTRVLSVKERTKSHIHKIRRRHAEDDADNMEDEDARDDAQESDNDAQQHDDDAQESDDDVQERDDEVQRSDDDARTDSDAQDDDTVQNDDSQSGDGAEDSGPGLDNAQNYGGDRDDREGNADDDDGRQPDDDQ